MPTPTPPPAAEERLRRLAALRATVRYDTNCLTTLQRLVREWDAILGEGASE